VARRDPLQPDALGAVVADRARQLHRRPHAAGARRHGRAGSAAEQPLRIAEDIATVDHLSEGRFDFGVGRSGSPRAYNALGIPYAESQARFVESLEVIREAWKGQPFSFQGTFHRFENVVVSPRPYQTPHPPMRMAANSPDTFPLAGRLGLRLFVGVRDLDVAELPDHIAAYRKGWRDGGHAGDGDVCLRILMYAAPTRRRRSRSPTRTRCSSSGAKRRWRAGASSAGPSSAGSRASTSSPACRTRRSSQARGVRLRLGLIERLGRLRDDLSLNGVIAELNPGGMLSMEQMLRTLRILTHEVVPALR